MKRVLLITAFMGMLAAEEPQSESLNLLSLEKTTLELTPPPANAEANAKHEIESFFESEKDPTPALPEDPTLETSEETSQQFLSVTQEAPVEVTNEHETSIESAPVTLNSEDEEEPETFSEVASAATPLKLQAQENSELAALEQKTLEAEVNGETEKDSGIMIDLAQVFAGSPTIYTTLFILSVGSFCLWFYSLLALRTSAVVPASEMKALKEKLITKQYDDALTLCQKQKSILFKMLASGLLSREHGQTTMLEMMKAEGRRASTTIWQKTALLNDVAIIAPMIGLLGTVLGMFYAFYDLNRSMESITTLFDGLGISVGTTVGGLVVAIVAMLFHSIAKYRLVRQLTMIENEANSLANLIDTRGQ